MNLISSRRSLTITCVHWQCSQNISLVKIGKDLFDPKGGRCGGNGGRGGSMAGRGGGWLAKRLIVSNEGCGGGGLAVHDGRSLSESKKGEVMWQKRLGEIPGEVIRESGGDTIGLDGRAVW
ncbi:hypothetical protein Tco_0158262 [Tanacetum coccineum]